MHGAARHAGRIKQTGRALAYHSRTESGNTLRTGEVGDQGGFGEALKVDRKVVPLGAQLVLGAPPGKRIVAAEDHDAVDKAVAFEQRHPFRLHHPGDARFGKTMLE